MRSRAKKHQDKERKKARRARRIATGRRPRQRDMEEVKAEGGSRFRHELMAPIEKQSKKKEKEYNKERYERHLRQGRIKEGMIEKAAKAMGIELP